MEKDGYGSFGANASKYGAARQAFPEEIFKHLKEWAGSRTTVLDMGCGTGIPSRQLADYGFIVTGSDIDERMIEQAKIDSRNYGITYVTSPSDKLPFKNESFDIITAFSAFHWFCDDQSLAEIQRVLSDEGLFFIVNKNETGDMKEIIKNTLKPFLDSELPKDVKKDYDPVMILRNHGLNNVQEYNVSVVEEYSIDDAVLYAQSMSIWNLVRKECGKALGALKNTFRAHSQNGIVLRPLEVRAVSVLKNLL